MNQPATLTDFGMPKACVSCVHYQPIGFDHDPHCPFTDHTGRKRTRTAYGSCSAREREVFVTELCPGYQCEPGVICYPVTNRPAPRQSTRTITTAAPKAGRNFYPKAGRCRGCAKLADDCSALPFETMPVHRTDGADTVVICTEFRQLNHDDSLRPGRKPKGAKREVQEA